MTLASADSEGTVAATSRPPVRDVASDCNVVWETPSTNSLGSMPLGNGDVGVNVWVEGNGDLLFYVSKVDAFDAGHSLPKLGRVRLRLDPPMPVEPFRQTLVLYDGAVTIRGGDVNLRVWVDAHHPVVRVTGARFGFNMISAVSPKGQMRFMVVQGKVAAKQFCEFLRRLVFKSERPIFLILDGHPVHRSANVKQLVESMKDKLQLFYLPPYSPELNPDEWVWNDLKNNGIGRMSIAGPDDMKHKVISHLKFLQRNPVLIRSFFQADTTRYAA